MTVGYLKGRQAPASALRIFHPGDKAPGPDLDPSTAPQEIADARLLQARAASAGALFEKHGFALIEHRTAVEDWGLDDAAQAAFARIYPAEIEAIVRQRLYPGRRLEIDQRLKLVRRGGPEDAIYADWVHQDFGLAADDFRLNLAGIAGEEMAEAWAERYARDDVVGCVAISCWRTVGMAAPLRHMPLALCDPTSVAMADVVPIGQRSDGGVHHIGLRYDPRQRWFSYPAMRGDELLAFKLFDCRKDDPGSTRLRSVFHAAFDDPDMPPDAERRQSCEHRVVVMLLAD